MACSYYINNVSVWEPSSTWSNSRKKASYTKLIVTEAVSVIESVWLANHQATEQNLTNCTKLAQCTNVEGEGSANSLLQNHQH